MLKFKEFFKGIKLKAVAADPSDNEAGTLWYNSAANRIKAYVQGAVRVFVSEDQAQTLTNKTLTTPVINEIVTSTDTNLNLNPNGTGKVVTDNLALSGNTIESTNSNGNIVLDPNGTGVISAASDIVPSADNSSDIGSAANNLAEAHTRKIVSNDSLVVESASVVDITPTTDFTVTAGDGVGITAASDIELISGAGDINLTANNIELTGDVTITGSLTPGSMDVSDANFEIQDNSDPTKIAKFQVSGITAATTRTFTFPDANTTLVGTDASQTLTNKTITTPVINQINTSTDTNLNLNPNGTGKVVTDNLALSGNTIESTDTDGNINLSPNGSGEVVIDSISIGSETIESTGSLYLQSSTGGLGLTASSGDIAITAGAASTGVSISTDLDISLDAPTVTLSQGEVTTGTDTNLDLTPDGTGKVRVESGASKGIDVQSAGAMPIGATVGNNVITLGGVTSTISIPGSLQVTGSNVALSVTGVTVGDKNILVNTNGANDATSEGAGITVDRTTNDGSLIFKDASGTKWAAGLAGSEIDLVGTTSTQTLTNKTLTAPVIATITNNSNTLTLPTTADTLVGRATTDTLTNKTLTAPAINGGDLDGGTASNTNRITLPKNTKTNLDGLTRKEGTVVYATDLDKVFYDDGSTLNEVGSGSGSGGINYIENYGAEVDTTGWASYDDGSAIPVDGTGGSFSGFARTTSSPLRGDGSFEITPAGGVGEGASYAFTIDSADQGRVLGISLDYSIQSGTVEDGWYTVWIYDVTNSVLIQPTPYKIPSSTAGVKYKYQSTFQTNSNSTSYRLLVHLTTDLPAPSHAMKFDNVFVGPEARVFGAPVTDWVDFTPTGSWVTNTTYTGKWRRVGDQMELQYQVAIGGGVGTPGALFLNLPSGHTIDTGKITNTSGETYLDSTGGMLDSGLATLSGIKARYLSTTAVALVSSMTASHSGNAPLLADVVSHTFPIATPAIGDRVWVYVNVPILGWSSSVQVSSDASTRVVAAEYNMSSGINPAGSYIDVTGMGSKVLDTHNAYNTSTGVYTVPVAGIYECAATISWGSSTTNAQQYNLRVAYTLSGAASTTDLDIYTTVSTTGSYPHLQGKKLLNCNAGDTIKFQISSPSATTSNLAMINKVMFQRLSGPSQIAASEKVTVIAKTASAQSYGIGADVIAAYGTVEKDTHGAWNASTYTFTAPRAGDYRISAGILFASAAWAAGDNISLAIKKNGSILRFIDYHTCYGTANQYKGVNGYTVVPLLAGETLQVQVQQNSASSRSLHSAAEWNVVTITSE